MAESNQIAIRAVPELTYNVTPVNDPNWFEIRHNSEALNGAPRIARSEESRSDRQPGTQIKVGTDVNGQFTTEFSAQSHDAFIEAVMGDTWATGVADQLEIGNVDRSFTFEKEYGDLTNAFIWYSGMRASSFNMDFVFGQQVTTVFQFAGAGTDVATASQVGAGTSAPSPTTVPFNAAGQLDLIEIDDVVTPSCFKRLNLVIDNSLRAQECIGSDAPRDQLKGTALVTGTLDFLHTDGTQALVAAIKSQDSVKIRWRVNNGTNSYTFTIPAMKLSGDDPANGGLDTDVVVSTSFSGEFDQVFGSAVRIERT